jgi:hypothetical protein
MAVSYDIHQEFLKHKKEATTRSRKESMEQFMDDKKNFDDKFSKSPEKPLVKANEV